MKKVFCVVLSLVLVAGLLTCCGSPAPRGSGITAEEILSNFEANLDPIADQFQLTLLEKTELRDLEGVEGVEPATFAQHAVITDKVLSRSYNILIYYTKAKGPYTVMMMADKGSRTDTDFALLSYYLYKSMGLPDMDAQEFYDQFSLLTEEPSGTMTIESWELWAFCVADTLTFSATFGAE